MALFKKKCPSCSKSNKADADFCIHCGVQFDVEEFSERQGLVLALILMILSLFNLVAWLIVVIQPELFPERLAELAESISGAIWAVVNLGVALYSTGRITRRSSEPVKRSRSGSRTVTVTDKSRSREQKTGYENINGPVVTNPQGDVQTIGGDYIEFTKENNNSLFAFLAFLFVLGAIVIFGLATNSFGNIIDILVPERSSLNQDVVTTLVVASPTPVVVMVTMTPADGEETSGTGTLGDEQTSDAGASAASQSEELPTATSTSPSPTASLTATATLTNTPLPTETPRPPTATSRPPTNTPKPTKKPTKTPDDGGGGGDDKATMPSP